MGCRVENEEYRLSALSDFYVSRLPTPLVTSNQWEFSPLIFEWPHQSWKLRYDECILSRSWIAALYILRCCRTPVDLKIRHRKIQVRRCKPLWWTSQKIWSVAICHVYLFVLSPILYQSANLPALIFMVASKENLHDSIRQCQWP